MREGLKVTQAQLAVKCGLSPSTIHQIERGRNVTIHALEKIARELGETLTLMIYGHDSDQVILFVPHQTLPQGILVYGDMDWSITAPLRSGQSLCYNDREA